MTPKTEIKEEKKEAVSKLADAMRSAKAVVFMDYTGLDVASITELRARIKDADGRMSVAKNTLLRLAGEKAGVASEALSENVLSGQTAVIFGEDAISPIQALGKFSKETEKGQMKAGIVEGDFQDASGLLKISKLPSKEILYANLVGTVSASMYGLVNVLSSKTQELVFVLEQAKRGGDDNG